MITEKPKCNVDVLDIMGLNRFLSEPKIVKVTIFYLRKQNKTKCVYFIRNNYKKFENRLSSVFCLLTFVIII